MVVDDEEDIRKVLKWFFESKDYEVIEAKDGEECLKKIKGEKPDIILLDIMMPGLDGWEVSRKIKEDESFEEIPVSMVSVLSEPEDLEKSRTYAHADMHISKPIDFYMLNKTVKALIGGHGDKQKKEFKFFKAP